MGKMVNKLCKNSMNNKRSRLIIHRFSCTSTVLYRYKKYILHRERENGKKRKCKNK